MNETRANGGRLTGRTVLVTGGGSGIGRATARRAAREGAAVAVVDRHRDNAEETAAMILGDGGTASAYPCDVADDAEVERTVAAANDDLGRISGVVTAAGIFHGPDLRPAHEVSVDDFMAVLRVNLVGTFAAIKHALPHLVEGGGAIVDDRVDRRDPRARLRRGLHREQGRGRRAHPAARGAVRPARRARELHLPGWRRHADDRPARSRLPRRSSARSARFRSAATRNPRTSATSRCSSSTDDARHLTGVTIPVEGGTTIT